MKELIKATNTIWSKLRDAIDQDNQDQTQLEALELVCVLQRILMGKPILKAFGAPGDWGYGAEMGQAVLTSLQNEQPDPNRWHDLRSYPKDLPDAEIQVLAYDGERHQLAYIGDGDVWMEVDNDEPTIFVPVSWRHLDNPAA